ncbi:MAG: hypothetical protein WKH64_12635 [Chloroflexia bacterium]
MYWISSSERDVDFIDADLSGRYEVGIDEHVELHRGDWVICIDPNLVANGPGVNLTLSQVTFQYIPFSTETYVKSQIALHVDPVTSPDPHAQYLTQIRANPLYSAIQHTHYDDIADAINQHKLEEDPHPIYTTPAENNALYALIQHVHAYEPLGAVYDNEQKTDPHPQYITSSEGNALYSSISHLHDDRYPLLNHTHPLIKEVIASDGAGSAKIFVGNVAPTAALGLLVGDLWIDALSTSSVAPPAPVHFRLVSCNGSRPLVEYLAFWLHAYRAGTATVARRFDRLDDNQVYDHAEQLHRYRPYRQHGLLLSTARSEQRGLGTVRHKQRNDASGSPFESNRRQRVDLVTDERAYHVDSRVGSAFGRSIPHLSQRCRLRILQPRRRDSDIRHRRAC